MLPETQKLFDQVAKLGDDELRNFLACLNLELHLRIVKFLKSEVSHSQGLYSIPGEKSDAKAD